MTVNGLLAILTSRVSLLNTFLKSFLKVNEISEIRQFWVTIATNCRVLTRSTNVSYVVGHGRKSRLFAPVHHVYYVTIDNILMWICEAKLVFIMQCHSVYEDFKGFFPFQNMYVEDVHID
jgi:hypothetical protein